VRGADRYTDEQKHKFENILTREQQSMRVPPRSQSVVHDVGKKQPVDRVGPNVVSKFFYNKVVNQREKDFWKKPWGRKKVDLPLPSYLRDFKDCDTHLLGAHFAHQRRNVGISKDAETSERMMRSLSVPLSVPGPPPRDPHLWQSRCEGRWAFTDDWSASTNPLGEHNRDEQEVVGYHEAWTRHTSSTTKQEEMWS